MGLVSKLTLSAFADLHSSLDLAEAVATLNKSYTLSLANGTGVGQADKVFHDNRQIAASGNEDLDLSGSLLDPLGGAFTLARVKGLIVRAADANVNDVLVGGAAANAWAALLGATGQVRVRPGAIFAAFAGSVVSGGAPDPTAYVVTPGTGDLLRITNGGAGTTVNYDIIVIGSSV